MGNGNSVAVSVAQPGYYPGQEVQGNVYLQVTAPFRLERDDYGIVVSMEGNMHTQWEEKKQDGEHTRTVYYRGNQRVFDLKFPLTGHPSLMQWRSSPIPQGQYVFPFAFWLPKDLPNTFFWRHHGGAQYDDVQAYLTYTIRAKINKRGPDLNDTREIEIYPLAQSPDYQAVSGPVEKQASKKVKTVGLFSRGMLHMTARMEKDTFVVNEDAMVTTTINNESKVDVDKMKINMEQHILISDGSKTITLKTKRISRSTYPGCKSKSRSSPAATPVRIAQFDCPAIQSRLMKCEYFIKVQADLPMASDLEVLFPVKLFARASEMLPAGMTGMWQEQRMPMGNSMEAPPGWQPQPMPGTCMPMGGGNPTPMNAPVGMSGGMGMGGNLNAAPTGGMNNAPPMGGGMNAAPMGSGMNNAPPMGGGMNAAPMGAGNMNAGGMNAPPQ